jgi:hypothetical protein
MPEISRFYGIVIAMFYNDHNPPHFHVRYGGARALVAIETLVILEGRLPVRAHSMVKEWAAQHRDELMQNWRKARALRELSKIEPLE